MKDVTVCLGYRCLCGRSVAVYRFFNTGELWESNRKPGEYLVTCSACQAQRLIRIDDIESLLRWNEAAA